MRIPFIGASVVAALLGMFGEAKSQDFCSDILKHGIRDEYNVLTNSKSRQQVADLYCRNQASLEQDDRTGGFSFGYSDILGSTTTDTKVRRKEFSDALCSQSSRESEASSNFTLAAKIANEAIVKAWSECTSNANLSGFIHFARPSRTVPGAFNYTIEFLPTNTATAGTISVALDNATCSGTDLRDLTVRAGAPVNLLCARINPGGVRLAPTAEADGENLGIVELDLSDVQDKSASWVMIRAEDFHGNRIRNSWGILEVELYDISGDKVEVASVEYSSCWLNCDRNRNGKTIPSAAAISDSVAGISEDGVWRFWAPSEQVQSDEDEWIKLFFSPSTLSRIVVHHWFSGGCMRDCGDRATSKDRAAPRTLSIVLGNGTHFTANIANENRSNISMNR